MPRSSRARVHLVTQAQTPKSQDIGYRERRYLIMMGIRLVCFVLAIIVFVNGGGWLTVFPAVGAILIPYFAVIFANGGREPNNTRGFQEYQPNLPERSPSGTPPGQVYLRGTAVTPGPPDPSADSDQAGHSGGAGPAQPPGAAGRFGGPGEGATPAE